MKNNIVYFRYLTSYRAVHDPYFCLESCRQAERESLVYALENLNARMKDLKKCIVDCLK